MAENKTRPTGIEASAFLEAVADPARREDAHRVTAMMERVTGWRPAMWGPSIVGFGWYRYRYESGREGRAPVVGFSPRAKELTLYLADGFAAREALRQRLGRHRTGKSCLYLKRLSDVDEAVLERLVAESVAHMRATYETGPS